MKEILSILLFSLVYLLATASFSFSEALDNCEEIKPYGAGYVLGSLWSGTALSLPAVYKNGNIYFAYYDENKQMTVASFDKKRKILCKRRIDTYFSGWDSHKYIVISFDANDRLHIAGNMHASHLVYATTKIPNSIDGLMLQDMVKSNEGRVTYPRFLKDKNGRLLFFYRSGVSGDGEWIVNRLNGESWNRLIASPIFGSVDNGEAVSAYPSNFIRGADGVVRVGVVWRHSPDVASNFAVTYAETEDFMHWRGSVGNNISVPLLPSNMDVVEQPGENSGLMNPPQVAAVNGRPVIAFSRYDTDGMNALILARPNELGWTTRLIARSPRRSIIKGTGSIDDVPRISEIDPTGSIVFSVRGALTLQYSFDVASLKLTGEPVRPKAITAGGQTNPPDGLTDARLQRVDVLDAATGAATGDYIFHYAQPQNNDVPRACTVTAPRSCDPPPSPAVLLTP